MRGTAVQIDPGLERVTQTIVERFDPERVVLFGSRARGDAHADSDYDILVVLDTELAGRERDSVVLEAIRHHRLWTEVVVQTPAEFLRKREDVGTLVYAAVHEGRVLYERPGSTLGAIPPARVREVPDGPPESLADWLARVDSDFHATEQLLRDDEPSVDAICFHAHAGVEKLLKAVLIARHTPPPRTHDLPVLLAECPEPLRDDERVKRACALLESLWPKSRYPEAGMPTADDARGAAEGARTLRQVVGELKLV